MNLLDIIGDEAKTKLIYEFKSRRGNTAELRIRHEIHSIAAGFTSTLYGFERCLYEWLQNTCVGNSSNFWQYYKIVRDGRCLEVWHTNSEGDPDRLMCTVREEEVSHG